MSLALNKCRLISCFFPRHQPNQPENELTVQNVTRCDLTCIRNSNNFLYYLISKPAEKDFLPSYYLILSFKKYN